MHEQQSHCQYHLSDLAISQETNNEARLWVDGLGDVLFALLFLKSGLRGK